MGASAGPSKTTQRTDDDNEKMPHDGRDRATCADGAGTPPSAPTPPPAKNATTAPATSAADHSTAYLTDERKQRLLDKYPAHTLRKPSPDDVARLAASCKLQ